MNKIIIIATLIVVLAIGVTIWLSSGNRDAPLPAGETAAPPQFDTTGGQEMRPRWSNGGGQADDAGGN